MSRRAEVLLRKLTEKLTLSELIDTFSMEKTARGERIPVSLMESAEVIFEDTDRTVPFSEYPKGLKKWFLDEVERKFKEAEREGTAWIEGEEKSVVIVKQRNGNFRVALFPEFVDGAYDRAKEYYKGFQRIRKTMENASLDAYRDGDLFDHVDSVFQMIDELGLTDDGDRLFYRLYETLHEYLEFGNLSEEQAEKIREILKKYPEAGFHAGSWDFRVKVNSFPGEENFTQEFNSIKSRLDSFVRGIEEVGLDSTVHVSISVNGIELFSFYYDEEMEKAAGIVRDVQNLVDSGDYENLILLLKENFPEAVVERAKARFGIEEDNLPSL